MPRISSNHSLPIYGHRSNSDTNGPHIRFQRWLEESKLAVGGSLRAGSQGDRRTCRWPRDPYAARVGLEDLCNDPKRRGKE